MRQASCTQRRLISLPVQGFLMIGPVLHYWYGLNASIAPGTGTGAALIRLVSCTALYLLPALSSACHTLAAADVSGGCACGPTQTRRC